MNLNQDFSEILKKGGAALAIRIVGFLAGYLFIYMTVHYFGAETQGRLSLSFSIMVIGSLLCRLGVDVNFVKVFAIKDNLNNARGIFFKILPVLLIITLIAVTLILLFAPIISQQVFKDPELLPFIYWTAPCILLFTFILVNAAVLRGLRKNTIYAFLFNGGRFLFALIILGILLVVFEHSSLMPVVAHTTAILILFVVSVYSVKKYIYPRVKETSYKVKPFIKDSFPMLLSASMIVFLGWTDTIVLGIFRDSDIVGVYSVLLKIAAVISFSLQAIDSILAPKLSNAYHQNDMHLFKKLIKFSTIINAIVAVGAVLVIIIFNDFILGIFGEEFKLATTALFILCGGQLFNAVFGPVGSIFQMTGHQKVFQNILVVAFIINLLLNILLAQKYGINGVACATATSLIFSKLVSTYYIKKRIWVKG